MLLNCWLCA